MRTRSVVVPLLAAGVCSAAWAQNGLRTLYLDECGHFFTQFAIHQSGNGLGWINNNGNIHLIFVRPDGVTQTALPSDIPGLTITDQPSRIQLGGTSADGSTTAILSFGPEPLQDENWAYAVVRESGVQIQVASTTIASPSLPLQLTTPLGILSRTPRSMNSAGVSIARPTGGSSTQLVAFGPGIEARAFRGIGEQTPGINAVILPETRIPVQPDELSGEPQAGVQYDINASGRAVYHTTFELGGTNQTAAGIFIDDPEFAAPLLRSDQPNAHGFRLDLFANTIRINNASNLAMVGSVHDGQSSEFGVWSVTPDGEATLRVRDGDVFPGRGGVGEFQTKLSYEPSGPGRYGGFPTRYGNVFVQNDRGDIAFESSRMVSNNQVVLFSGADGERATIFDVTEILPPAVLWQSLTLPIFSPDARSLAVRFTVSSSAASGFDQAIYVSGLDHGLHEVVRKHQLLEVAPGDFREAWAFHLLDFNGVETTFRASFADGSCGVFTYTIPACPADLNNDGVVDADDFFLFLQFFADGDPRADINNDGVIDADDFFAYLTLFAQGC